MQHCFHPDAGVGHGGRPHFYSNPVTDTQHIAEAEVHRLVVSKYARREFGI